MRAEFAPRTGRAQRRDPAGPGVAGADQAVAEDTAGLDAEASYPRRAVRRRVCLAGAALGERDDKARLRALNEEISSKETAFELALQADSNGLSAVVVDDAAELDGLTAGRSPRAAPRRESRALDGRYLLTLVLPTAHPTRRAHGPRLRRRLRGAVRLRGSRGGAHDTRAPLLDVLRLVRSGSACWLRRPRIPVTADNTAGSTPARSAPARASAAPAACNARREQEALTAQAGFDVEPWDWAFYAERVRARSTTSTWPPCARGSRPSGSCATVSSSPPAASTGSPFAERTDLRGYYPDVRVFEVSRDGTPIGLYLLDLYTRDSKRGGAWMSSFVDQAALLGPRRRGGQTTSTSRCRRPARRPC